SGNIEGGAEHAPPLHFDPTNRVPFAPLPIGDNLKPCPANRTHHATTRSNQSASSNWRAKSRLTARRKSSTAHSRKLPSILRTKPHLPGVSSFLIKHLLDAVDVIAVRYLSIESARLCKPPQMGALRKPRSIRTPYFRMVIGLPRNHVGPL